MDKLKAASRRAGALMTQQLDMKRAKQIEKQNLTQVNVSLSHPAQGMQAQVVRGDNDNATGLEPEDMRDQTQQKSITEINSAVQPSFDANEDLGEAKTGFQLSFDPDRDVAEANETYSDMRNTYYYAPGSLPTMSIILKTVLIPQPLPSPFPKPTGYPTP